MGNFVLEAKIISGNNIGQKVYISRLTLSPSLSDTKLPFTFQRKQFPIVVSFVMAINKSQGQSLKNVGIFLPKPIFSHGQLYVVLSRVTSRVGLKLLICDDEGRLSNKTYNVVYKEVFRIIYIYIYIYIYICVCVCVCVCVCARARARD